jgi:hypothetical protein
MSRKAALCGERAVLESADDQPARPEASARTAMNDLYNHAMGWVSRLDRQDWFLVFLALVALGFLALQGFGSRKNY